MAACHARPTEMLAGPRPGGLVRWRSGPQRGNGACAPGALVMWSPRVACVRRRGGALASSLVAAGQWQGAAGELTGATGRASGKAVRGGAHERRCGVEAVEDASGGSVQRRRGCSGDG
jgi:hypothetical protein